MSDLIEPVQELLAAPLALGRVGRGIADLLKDEDRVDSAARVHGCRGRRRGRRLEVRGKATLLDTAGAVTAPRRPGLDGAIWVDFHRQPGFLVQFLNRITKLSSPHAGKYCLKVSEIEYPKKNGAGATWTPAPTIHGGTRGGKVSGWTICLFHFAHIDLDQIPDFYQKFLIRCSSARPLCMAANAAAGSAANAK